MIAHVIATVITWSGIGLVIIDLAMFRWAADYDTWNFYVGPLIVAWSFFLAVQAWHQGDYPAGIFCTTIGGFIAWNWWRQNKDRFRRRAAKALGRVVDMGGRLKVVNIPSDAA